MSSSAALARLLLACAGILVLPGTRFAPPGGGGREVRVAFANPDAAGLADLIDRLAACPAPALVSKDATA